MRNEIETKPIETKRNNRNQTKLNETKPKSKTIFKTKSSKQVCTLCWMNFESTLNQRLNLNSTLIPRCFNVVCPVGPYCDTEESIEHLIFNCNLSKDIWRYTSDKVHFDITWKIIVIGFYSECNNTTYTFNNIFSFIAFKIYKYKMKCRILNEDMSTNNIRLFLKKMHRCNNIKQSNC